MEETHVDAVMILGQVFDKDHEFFDFGGQDVTKRYDNNLTKNFPFKLYYNFNYFCFAGYKP